MSFSEWKKYKLGDAAELRKEQVKPGGKEQIYIGLEHIEQQTLRLNGVGSSSDVISNKFKFYSGDVLYGKLRPYFRKVYQPKFEGVCSTDIYVIKNKDGFDKSFIFYLAATEEFTQIANSGSIGTRMPRADWGQLELSEWDFPGLQTQQHIASILSSLDNKIELNRQTNQTLEAMAQTLFKEMCLPKGDVLPEGWRVEPLDEVADFLNGLALQKYPATDENDYLPVIKIREIKAGITSSTDKASRDVPAKYVIKNGDLLFSWSATLEVMFWCYGEGALNQHLFKVTSNRYPLWFCYLLISYHLDEFRKIASDKTTTMGHIQRKHLTEAMCFIPSDFDKIDATISPIIEQIKNNNYETQTLAALRDSLLPRLMKGEIEV